MFPSISPSISPLLSHLSSPLFAPLSLRIFPSLYAISVSAPRHVMAKNQEEVTEERKAYSLYGMWDACHACKGATKRMNDEK